MTFEWNREDLGGIFASLLNPPGQNAKFFIVPIANYVSSSYDAVKMGDKVVGLSRFGGYSYNERVGLSLGVVDENINVGDVLTLVWGEESGGSRKKRDRRAAQAGRGTRQGIGDPVRLGGP